MAWENVPVVLLLVVSGGLTALFSVFIWQRRASTTAAVPLVVIMAAAAVWSWSAAFGYGSHTSQLMIVAGIIEQAAIAIIPVAFIQFCLQYTEKITRYGTISWGLLLIIPILIGVLLIANMVLPFMMQGIPPQPNLSSPYGAGPGILFWVFYVYGIFLVLTGVAIIIQHYKSASGVFRGQLACLLVATIPPLFSYTGFVFQIGPFGYLDITPIVFIGSVVALGAGIERFALFDLVPVECGAALEQIPTGIVLLDRLGRIVEMNQAADQFLGTAGKEIMGFSIREVLPPYEIPYPVQTDAAGGHRQTLRRERDGMVQYIDLQCIPLSTAAGKRRGYVILFREITDQHLTDQSLAMARKKVNLLTGITRHDILNQLTIMIMHNELLRDAIKDPAVLKSLHEQEKAASTIQRQIAFTKLEVFADPLITRVFHNLLENSLRYGENVTTISLYHEQSPDGLTIVYQDNGIGINNEEKEKIFKRGSGKRSGFGLFFSREILSLTGITISETGKPGTGARFEIGVPWGTFRFRKENSSDVGR